MLNLSKLTMFWRIDAQEMWGFESLNQPKFHYFMPFDEIKNSKAPHLIINKAAFSITVNADGARTSSGRYVIIDDEVYSLIKTWQISPGYGGHNTLSEFLSACY